MRAVTLRLLGRSEEQSRIGKVGLPSYACVVLVRLSGATVVEVRLRVSVAVTGAGGWDALVVDPNVPEQRDVSVVGALETTLCRATVRW